MNGSLLYRGKVRDVYDVGDGLLVMVASDRISAFDRVFAEPVPDKGRVLTAMTAFWVEQLAEVAPSHLVSTDPAEVAARLGDGAAGTGSDGPLAGRAMLVRRAEMLPIECIVRGYLSGSAWKEYRRSQTMHGEPLPPGLEESSRLPEPSFTPSTKASEGHDENISYEQAERLVGRQVAAEAREISLEAYRLAAGLALERGIVVADTKLELGFIDGRLAICDEILTPDSSRFWPAESWRPGAQPPSFDKQPVRDWVEQSGWDKESPPPPLPPEVVSATRDRYVEAYERLTGRRFAEWWGAGG
jgi:phosphoribosylaminoimidazole-succinocarboxamide synthase